MTNAYGTTMANACRRFGDRVALRSRGEVRTYAQLLDHSARLANALAGQGVRPGDHVAAMLEDRVNAMEVYLACAFGGFTLVHVNDRLVATEVQHVLTDSGSRVLVHTDGRSDIVEALEGRDELGTVVTLGADRPRGALGYDDLLAGASSQLPSVDIDHESIAIIGYTSGTTGFPKGARISQRALVACVQAIPHVYRLPMYGSCAFTGTLSFVSGVWGVILPHLTLGASLSFLAGTPMDRLIDVMVDERSTFTYAPSPLVPAFVEQVQRRPEVLDTLMSVLHSASPLPPVHMKMLIDTIGDRVVEVWGMTESAGPVTTTTRLDYAGRCDADDLYSTVGRATANATIRAIDVVSGEPVGPGEVGELVVEADTMFSGYHGRPEQTAEVFDGTWYRTGDIGYIDAAGYVYVTDRAKDMIITGGMNVYPAEVEAALVRLPGVAEVAVFAVPDDRWGEAVATAIVTSPGASVTADDVVAHAREHLASFKKPQRVFFVDSLPRNVSMKVQRHVLRDRFAADPSAGETGAEPSSR